MRWVDASLRRLEQRIERLLRRLGEPRPEDRLPERRKDRDAVASLMNGTEPRKRRRR